MVFHKTIPFFDYLQGSYLKAFRDGSLFLFVFELDHRFSLLKQLYLLASFVSKREHFVDCCARSLVCFKRKRNQLLELRLAFVYLFVYTVSHLQKIRFAWRTGSF